MDPSPYLEIEGVYMQALLDKKKRKYTLPDLKRKYNVNGYVAKIAFF